ncbi:Cation efflux family protein [Penicillium ucsense]|uniref:Cation efflux family protein n=1 Tax=Penicillium ucsense TaxID=2839758 RepID=A0A8J8W442_9EURO|nr:Cation efflux family protein [Penicillium ucsense]KAF7736589.1 Cation efflux family protein [Penicillium ucsense]
MLRLSRVQRLSAVIGISFCFFVSEISIGFYTHSLALVADAFHYLSDLVGFIIALVAAIVAERTDAPQALTFGWQRIQLLGAFFNGVLLFGLGLSVFLQSIERFIDMKEIENPKLVLIMGCVGFTLNLVSVVFLHDHSHSHHGHAHSHDDTQQTEKTHCHDHQDHHSTITNPQSGKPSTPITSSEASKASPNTLNLSPHPLCHPDVASRHSGDTKLTHSVIPKKQHIHHKHHVNAKTLNSKPHRDLAMMGVLIHVMGDCANNLGVIIAASVIWFAHYGGRFYADPAVSMGIAIMILASSIPLIKTTGLILLQSAPTGVHHSDVAHDLQRLPGVLAVHELHIWQLNQTKSLASAHIVLDGDASVAVDFESVAVTIRECFHAYGIHSVTLQPEIHGGRTDSGTEDAGLESGSGSGRSSGVESVGGGEVRERMESEKGVIGCKTGCGSVCLELTCCS